MSTDIIRYEMFMVLVRVFVCIVNIRKVCVFCRSCVHIHNVWAHWNELILNHLSQYEEYVILGVRRVSERIVGARGRIVVMRECIS